MIGKLASPDLREDVWALNTPAKVMLDRHLQSANYGCWTVLYKWGYIQTEKSQLIQYVQCLYVSKMHVVSAIIIVHFGIENFEIESIYESRMRSN